METWRCWVVVVEAEHIDLLARLQNRQSHRDGAPATS